jgi:crotonobetainyl-CoA:carnitine CoA-transferase CaiB-like acyl-CoA transferase
MPDALPLAGVNVVDLTWVMAGPAATRLLADFGASVVRVESTRRVDTARTVQPFHDGRPGPESSALYMNNNAGKLSITLDLGKPEGREVFLDLVRWADVVVESFSPGTMQSWGLDYGALAAVKPDLVMLSTCLMGQTGPLAAFAGYGNLAAAVSGFFEITGWPDRAPTGPFAAYTDYVSPRFTALALLAALDHRRRTGRGQYIDQSQVEAAVHFLSTAVLDWTVNGRVQGRIGNADPAMAPNGVYPVLPPEDWVAISVRDDQDWRALCGCMARPDLAADARYATTADRLARREELDYIVTEWTAGREGTAVESLLQAAGVPASVARSSAALLEDSQLRHLHHFVRLSHPVHGSTTVEGVRIRLSRTPGRVGGSPPLMGEHNQVVLEKILGYDEERIAELAASGALA